MEVVKICRVCNLRARDVSDLIAFPKNSGCSLGYANICKVCHNKQRRQYTMTPDQERNNKLKSTYGITLDEYKDIYAEQNGECAICKSHYTLDGYKSEKLHVDHCHQSGKVRGLLCHKCNTALGLLKDKTQNLLNAVDYLNTRNI